VPLLGFFLLPWTTLAYAVMWASSDGVNGFEWFIVVLAFLIDLGAFAGGGRRRAETR
jgi:ABC-type Na+ efflux pump permease subunit